MLRRMLGLASSRNRAIAESLYAQIVAAARQPVPYAGWNVPDTPLGRFEMLSVHVFLFMHRIRGRQGAMAELGQELTDIFFADIDQSLRELGISDMGVPKRMKKLARMFYGRAAAYGAAVEADDAAALAAALSRNIRPDAGDWRESRVLADHVLGCHRALAEQPDADLLRGVIVFQSPEGTTP